MSIKETTCGHPMRSALERCEADRTLHCEECGREVVRLALRKDLLVVASPLRRMGISQDKLGEAPAMLLHAGAPTLHQAMQHANHDGLDFYCPDCDRQYCEAEYRCLPQWDDGFYDYTLGICPEGHERIVDD